MPDNTPVSRGNLFTRDFLAEAIRRTPEWVSISDSDLDAFAASLQIIFDAFPKARTPNESQTEDDVIWPILARLGWVDALRQQNLAARGRDDVPDGLLFENAAAKAQANSQGEEWRRYALGLAIVESKRWLRPLDRRTGGRRGIEETTAPSSQMLRYLRRVEDLTGGKLRWGILTNGARWRLYYQGAKSVAEDFFELDLAAVLGVEGVVLFALDEEERRRWLRVFLVVFQRSAFIPAGPSATTFHQRALDLGRFYEERVAANLSSLVYDRIFPELAGAIAAAEPTAPLSEVRDAALILLYRLLFMLYAEDRNLLPVNDRRYDGYSLRGRVREDVGRRLDQNDTFSTTASRYWAVVDDLTRAIDRGDPSIGLPPYNGGLFDAELTPLLTRIHIGDAIMADVLDALSFDRSGDERRYINYRDLSVQQLGSIYERLLEQEIVNERGIVSIRPNIFARKDSGSYYTPDELVRLIVRETLDPLVEDRMRAFRERVDELASDDRPADLRSALLDELDPAARLLDLKVCDPAMGSGHFLVALVDYLADQVIAAMAEAETMVVWDDYVSPLGERIANIRRTIAGNARENRWTIDFDQLDDRHIIRRMVLKRCVYGVDKNPMAVELAKVSLWLHTFTVGAPLSFLDHHLRRGDSLFGGWVNKTMATVERRGGRALLLHHSVAEAMGQASSMRLIEGLTDVEIAEAKNSAAIFVSVRIRVEPLDRFMALLHALDWLNLRQRADRVAIQSWLDGTFGDAIDIALGKIQAPTEKKEGERFAAILEEARNLVEEQGFFNWQAAFPGVWEDWESEARIGGFHAVIGNPPWDRMKLQQVEWFASRRPEIAMATRAADRARMIAALKAAGDPLAVAYAKAADRAETAARIAREGGDYPLLSGGDMNLYSLFVERAMALTRPDGVVGLLTPSGIASDKTAAPFFRSIATSGRLKALYDFENRRTRVGKEPFFPDVDSRFKFNVFIASPERGFAQAQCAFFLQDVSEIADPERCFPLTAEDFARVNPNTGTAPVFRSRRDAELTKAIYGRLPVLVDRSGGAPVKAWPVRYLRMFDMTNDSRLFHTRKDLEEKDGAYPIGGNRWRSAAGDWVPLFVGRMIHQFDHRAASVLTNEQNLHNPALSSNVSAILKVNPDFAPKPQYWVSANAVKLPPGRKWAIAFRDVARSTDVRTIISAAVPFAGFGNKLPLLLPEDGIGSLEAFALLLANLNAMVLDFVARSKIHSTSVNWYILEQLPVVPLATYESTCFGPKTAAEIVREAVLELTYTAHDMAPFARDLGYVGADGTVKPPFVWNAERRLNLRAKLDALYFLLYGVMDRDDVRYIYSTFPIVEREELREHGCYISRDLCLAWMNALAAGDPDAPVQRDSG